MPSPRPISAMLLFFSLVWLLPALACASFSERSTPTPTFSQAAARREPLQVEAVALTPITQEENVITNAVVATLTAMSVPTAQVATEPPIPPTDTLAPLPVPAGATTTQGSNLRTGPGTNYDIAGGLPPGAALDITGRNQTSDWYQLADGRWIFASLVQNAPNNLAVVEAPASPAQPVAVAPTATVAPTPQPEVPSASASQRVEAGGVGLTVTNVQKMGQFGGFMVAEPGTIYLVVEVLIENLNRDEAVYNPLYFKAKDGNGFEYTALLIAPQPSLTHGELPRGDRARGNVAFQVQTTASGFVLSYKPLVLLGGYQEIRVNLGQ